MAFARVQAAQRGFYAATWRDIGDVFDIANASDFSDASVPYNSPGNPDYPLYGWMTQVPGTTPLYTYSLANGAGLSDPAQGVYGIDSAGHPLLSIPRYVV